MKLYEQTSFGLRVYDYTLDPQKTEDYKKQMLKNIPEAEKVYVAKATGDRFLQNLNACVSSDFLNCTYLENPQKEVYHEFMPQQNPDTKAVMGSYISSISQMYGTVHTFGTKDEYFIKTEGYTLSQGVYQMNNIIKVPKELFSLEFLLKDHNNPSWDLGAYFAFLFDLSAPAFFDDSLVQSMFSSGLVTKDQVEEKVELSKKILALKRRK